MACLGVLNIQGGIMEHADVVKRNNHQLVMVQQASDLIGLDAIILPGGESTMMRRIIDSNCELKLELKKFLCENPVYATCAGLILLSNEYFGILDVDVKRNGFGAQINSSDEILDWNGVKQQGLFIRAPYIETTNKFDHVCKYKERIVGVQTDKIMAMSFHPELTKDDTLFKKFVNDKINKKSNN